MLEEEAGRASVRSLREVSVTGPGSWLHVDGEDELSNLRNMLEASRTHTQGTSGWTGLEEAAW